MPGPFIATTDSLRVLVVDDEPMTIKMIGRALRDVCVVETATDGAAALERLRAGARYALVLCDVMMPRMTGLDLLQILRRDAPAQAERFVFVTGGARTMDDARRVEAAGVPTLLKPFSRAELVNIVMRYLRIEAIDAAEGDKDAAS